MTTGNVCRYDVISPDADGALSSPLGTRRGRFTGGLAAGNGEEDKISRNAGEMENKI